MTSALANNIKGDIHFNSVIKTFPFGNLGAKGSDIASAGTTNLANATGEFVDITGTTTITALGTLTAGYELVLRFNGVLTLTHNATSLILPGAANILTASGDIACFRSLGSGNWVCTSYLSASTLFVSSNVLTGSAVSLTSGVTANITNISLPAGIWMVQGFAQAKPASGTTTTAFTHGISTTSATLPTPSPNETYAGGNFTLTADQAVGLCIGPVKQILTGTTTLYLVSNVTFAVSTMGAYGWISAQKIAF